MTDRELLELAAKAAGNPRGTKIAGTGLFMANELYWDPLTDDGDALRLAMKLNIDILQFTGYLEVWAQAPMLPPIKEPMSTDPYAVTRRAIVRAAAAIGKEIS